MKALLVKELNQEKDECDIVLMFEDMKPVEINFMRRGSKLMIFMDAKVFDAKLPVIAQLEVR